MAKGCAQQPGFDYTETLSPVIRMDTLRVILALVPKKGLKLHHMDVKGVYLNGTLQETIYMRQPEGCEDGMGRVCKLVKTLYGDTTTLQVVLGNDHFRISHFHISHSHNITISISMT
jgi:hypothetical protein